MKDPKISVIVPVYNVEEYIPRCLDSIVKQTMKEIEIICINDGSTDNSLEILRAYAKQDDRITVIDKENGGVSSARNAGIRHAKGDYLMFVDSDDYLEKTICEACYKKIIRDSSDIVITNMFYVYPNSKIKAKCFETFKDEELFYFDEYCPDDFFSIMTNPGGILFKTTPLEFNENIKKTEDALYLWEYLLAHPKISIFNQPLYNYYQRSDSAMRNEKLFKNADVLKAAMILTETKDFQKASGHIQTRILDRFAQSVQWELYSFRTQFNICTNETYVKNVEQFLSLFDKYNEELIKKLRYYNKVKKELRKSRYNKTLKLAGKLFSITNENKHKVIGLCGVRFKFKYLKGQYKNEHDIINKIKHNQKKYPKDCYLMFDHLHDETVENIDTYSLFLYMKNIGKNVYYVMLKNSKLYKNLKEQNQLDGIIGLENSSKEFPGDFLETIYDVLLRTRAVITAFGENSPAANKFFKNNEGWQYICLQHGPVFLKEQVLVNGYLYPDKYDKYVISSDYECQIFKKYGFSDDKFIKAGEARWDLLLNRSEESEKSILLMFTWRRLNPLSFEKSLYKKNLLQLLNNKDLTEYLKLHNIKLYFAPHHALLTNQGIDFKIDNPNVEVIDTCKISQYIRKCSCLVTDFSSVAFDFMFQNKPVLCYLLDYEDRGLNKFDRKDLDCFDYKKYIFPNVYFDENSIVEKIKYYADKNFQCEADVLEKYDKFFYYRKDIRKHLTEEIDKICKSN